MATYDSILSYFDSSVQFIKRFARHVSNIVVFSTSKDTAVDNNGNTLKSGQQLSICHYDTLRCTYGVVLHTGMYHSNRRPPKEWNGLL